LACFDCSALIFSGVGWTLVRFAARCGVAMVDDGETADVRVGEVAGGRFKLMPHAVTVE
jgi:hypothetical protein